MLLPNFICVGAQKAGSSSLYKLLRSHPEIHVSETKEIHFFNIDSSYQEGVEYYSEFFTEAYNAEKLIGEFTPDYLQYSFVPRRILDTLGKIKILIILRNPLDRAYSQFNFHKMLGHEKKHSDFEKILEKEEVIYSIDSREEWHTPAYYKSKSLYASQVKRYQDAFGKENVHVIIFEEMLLNRDEPNLESTCEFLGVGENHKFTSQHSNPTILNFNSPNVRFMKKLKNAMLKVLPTALVDPIKEYVVEKTYKKPNKLPKHTKKNLYELHFKEDVARLQELTNKDFSIWEIQ